MQYLRRHPYVSFLIVILTESDFYEKNAVQHTALPVCLDNSYLDGVCITRRPLLVQDRIEWGASEQRDLKAPLDDNPGNYQQPLQRLSPCLLENY